MIKSSDGPKTRCGSRREKQKPTSGPARCAGRILICAGPVTLLCRKITAIEGGTCIKGLRRTAQFQQRIPIRMLLLPGSQWMKWRLMNLRTMEHMRRLFPGSRPGILTASFRTAAAFRSKTGRIFPGVTASAKAGSRIPGTVIPAGSSAGMQTFPGAAARSCPVPAVRRLPLLRRPAAQMPGKHRADAGCTSMATSTSSVSRRRQKPRNPRRNSRVQPRENRNGLPSWNLPLTSCHRRRRIKS